MKILSKILLSCSLVFFFTSTVLSQCGFPNNVKNTLSPSAVKFASFEVKLNVLIVKDDNGGGNLTIDDVEPNIDGAVEVFEDLGITINTCIRELHNTEIYNANNFEGRLFSFDCESFYLLIFESVLPFPNGGGIATGSEAGGEAWARNDEITIIHEIGHLFGLVHTFNLCGGNARELVQINGQRIDCNGNVQTCDDIMQIPNGRGDFCCDTPADSDRSECHSSNITIDANCNVMAGGVQNPVGDGCNQFVDGDNIEDLVSNYMSYYPRESLAGCFDFKFSDHQIDRMLTFVPSEFPERIGNFESCNAGGVLTVLEGTISENTIIRDADFTLGDADLIIEGANLTLINCNVEAAFNIVLKNGSLRLHNSTIDAGTCLNFPVDNWPGITIDGKGSIFMYNNSALLNARIPISNFDSNIDADVFFLGNDLTLETSSRSSGSAVDVTGYLKMAVSDAEIIGKIESKNTGSFNRGPSLVSLNSSTINPSPDGSNFAAFDLMDTHLRLGLCEIDGFSNSLDSEDSPRIRIVQNHFKNDGTSLEDIDSDVFLLFNNLFEDAVIESSPSVYYSLRNNHFLSSQDQPISCGNASTCIDAANSSTFNRFQDNIFNADDRGVTIRGDHSSTQFLCNVFDNVTNNNFNWGAPVNPTQANNQNGTSNLVQSAGNLFSASDVHISGNAIGVSYFYDQNIPRENPIITASGVLKEFADKEAFCGPAGIDWLPPVLEPDPTPQEPVGPVIFIAGCPVGQKCINPCPPGIKCGQNCPPGINCLLACPPGIDCTQPCPPGIDCTQRCPPGIDCTQPCPPGVVCTEPCPPGIDCTLPCYINCNPCLSEHCDPIRPINDEVLDWVEELYQDRESSIVGLQGNADDYLSYLISNLSIENKSELIHRITVDRIQLSEAQMNSILDVSHFFTEEEMTEILLVHPELMSFPKVNKRIFHSYSFSKENLNKFESSRANMSGAGLGYLLELDYLNREKSDLINYALERLEIMSPMAKLEAENIWLARKNEFSALLEIVDNYFEVREYDLMATKLAELKTSSSLSFSELSDCQNYEVLMLYLASELQGGREINKLDDLSTLEYVANAGTRYSSMKARGILRKFYDYDFDKEEYGSSIDKLLFHQEPGHGITSTFEQANNDGLTMYPNPSSGQYIFSNQTGNEIIVNIFSSTGTQVDQYQIKAMNHKEVISQLIPGTYLCKVTKLDGSLIKMSKLVIIN